MFPRPNGAVQPSPGQRPGCCAPTRSCPEGAPQHPGFEEALQASSISPSQPRAALRLPWARMTAGFQPTPSLLRTGRRPTRRNAAPETTYFSVHHLPVDSPPVAYAKHAEIRIRGVADLFYPATRHAMRHKPGSCTKSEMRPAMPGASEECGSALMHGACTCRTPTGRAVLR